MISATFTWLILIVATERATELIVSSKIFEPFRLAIKKWTYNPDIPPSNTVLQEFKVMLDYLVNCGYCVSVWVGALFGLFATQHFDNVFISWLTSALFLHGMANLYHVVYELIKRGRVKTYDIILRASIDNQQGSLENEDEDGV